MNLCYRASMLQKWECMHLPSDGRVAKNELKCHRIECILMNEWSRKRNSESSFKFSCKLILNLYVMNRTRTLSARNTRKLSNYLTLECCNEVWCVYARNEPNYIACSLRPWFHSVSLLPFGLIFRFQNLWLVYKISINS